MEKSEESEKLTSDTTSKKDDLEGNRNIADVEMNAVDSNDSNEKQVLSVATDSSSTDQPEDNSSIQNMAITTTSVSDPSTESVSKNNGNDKKTSEPNRSSSKRQRTPVVRIEHQYSEIYSHENNRFSKRKKNSNDITNKSHNVDNNSKSFKPSSSSSPSSLSCTKQPNDHSTAHSPNASSIGTNSSSNAKESDNASNIPSRTVQSNVTQTSLNRPQPTLRRRPPSYRWIGDGTLAQDGSTQYTKLEVKVGNHASLIQVGDTVLLCSGDMEEDELYGGPVLITTTDHHPSKDTARNHHKISNAHTNNQNTKNNKKNNSNTHLDKNSNEWIQYLENHNSNAQNGNDENFHYEKPKIVSQEHDSILGLVAGDIAINALDPFVARIESMWEEPKPDDDPSTSNSNDNISNSNSNKNNKDNSSFDDKSSDSHLLYHDERRARMKFRARWYFKKEDMQGLGGQFVGVPRDEVLKSMTPRDLVLGDQMDDNEVSTILGKCLVLRRKQRVATKPSTVVNNLVDNDTQHNPDGKSHSDPTEQKLPPRGAFICSYKLAIQKANSRSSVLITPYEGVDEPDPRLITNNNSSNKSSKLDVSNSNNCMVENVVIENVTNPSKMKQIDSGPCDDSNDCVNDQFSLPMTISSSEPKAHQERILDSNGDNKMSQNSDVAEDDIDSNTDVEKLSPLSSHNQHEKDNKVEVENESSENDDKIVESNGEESLPSEKQERSAKKPPTSEGVTTQGKIHVGENHQAIMPSLVTNKNQYRPCRSTKPFLVWQPDKLSGERVDEFMKNVSKILESYLDDKGINYPGNSLVYSLAQKIELKDSKIGNNHNSTVKMLRKECEVDKIMGLLHAQNYDTCKALNQVSSSPSSYMTLWTNKEKELFNVGFRRYCGSLRMITRGIGPTKSHKDVVDYHYRFKIPFQFLKYQEKKREQASRMLHHLDQKLFQGTLTKSDDQGMTKLGQNGLGNSTNLKKIKSWTSTGKKGKEIIGATEHRRVLAKDYLMNTRDLIGSEKYLELAMYLKLFHGREIDIHTLKQKIKELLKDYPEILMRFLEFLPKKLRA